jgi:hypothetical protein
MVPGGGFLAAWRLKRHAVSFVGSLFAEPEPDQVAWLAALEPNGDEDHARWELRYARRAAGMLAAQRDAVDDRTAAAVGRALTEAFHADHTIARDRAEIALRQFNERLAAYREVLAARQTTPTKQRLGQVLLTFLGRPTSASEDTATRAGEIVEQALASANAELRREFGDVSLPENIVPSEAAGR